MSARDGYATQGSDHVSDKIMPICLALTETSATMRGRGENYFSYGFASVNQGITGQSREDGRCDTVGRGYFHHQRRIRTGTRMLLPAREQSVVMYK